MSSIGMGNGGTGCFGGVEPAITNGARSSSVLPSAWWYVPSLHRGLAPSSRHCTLHLTLGISHQHAIVSALWVCRTQPAGWSGSGMLFGWELVLSFILVSTVYAVAIGEPSFGARCSQIPLPRHGPPSLTHFSVVGLLGRGYGTTALLHT